MTVCVFVFVCAQLALVTLGMQGAPHVTIKMFANLLSDVDWDLFAAIELNRVGHALLGTSKLDGIDVHQYPYHPVIGTVPLHIVMLELRCVVPYTLL